MKHHLTLLRYLYLRYRFYARCSCGWKSEFEYTAPCGAHLEFGKHLVEAHKK